MFKTTLKLFFLSLILTACDVINPSEEIPSYLKISKFEVEGINDLPPSANVQDVWVTVDNIFIGVYSFNDESITIPVLSAGSSVVTLRPGIVKDAGFNSIHEIYPYYNGYTEQLILENGKITEVTPKTSYTDDAFFVQEVTDDFETGLTRKYRSCLGCPTTLQVINKDSTNSDLFIDINGTALGLVEISAGSTDSISFTSAEQFGIPLNASQVWMEFDYKSNIIFTTGLEINNQFYFRITPFLTASPDGWTKVYFALIDDFSIAPGQAFNLVFSSPPSDGSEDYYLAIDNIRLIVPEI
ncbi:MAG: hypothetical protein RH860_16445 [Cytophagales bacterium]